MEKYKNAARNVLTPKVGYGLADELKRAGFWVNLVFDKPQAANTVLRNRMIESMDKKQAECLVLVSNDSDFTNVLKEARLRCLRTVVVGDSNDGALKRCADAWFSWKEIMLGKAKKEAVSVLGCWKDRDVLKSLEWTYRPEVENSKQDLDDSAFDNKDGDIDIMFDEGHDLLKEDVGPWWELHSDDNDHTC
ncbi:Zinc finger protein [Thalictrum thalictroides]|uniref:Zinc finger protein n=1 Tax=Thalictrum thalictroides TaxID=46969 RepID=A0A7J6XET4_THATH|nr:Zinc finger protein [Thalictrum thalictroides]